ncbi:ASCH domain-containing protein, partial [Cellulomonas edaphi]
GAGRARRALASRDPRSARRQRASTPSTTRTAPPRGAVRRSRVQVGVVRKDGANDDEGVAMSDETTGSASGGDDLYEGAGIATDADDRISAFWQAARGHVGFGKMETIVGGTPLDVVPPPSFSFGVGSEADEALAQVLDGTRAQTSAPREQFDELPRVGDLAIVLDAAGEPRALIRTTEVEDGADVVERFELVYPTDGPTPAVD